MTDVPQIPPATPPIEIPRKEEIKETYSESMRLLGDLKKGVPAFSAKLERTKEVVSFVYS
jgi:hypothetical protein